MLSSVLCSHLVLPRILNTVHCKACGKSEGLLVKGLIVLAIALWHVPLGAMLPQCIAHAIHGYGFGQNSCATNCMQEFNRWKAHPAIRKHIEGWAFFKLKVTEDVCDVL